MKNTMYVLLFCNIVSLIAYSIIGNLILNQEKKVYRKYFNKVKYCIYQLEK